MTPSFGSLYGGTDVSISGQGFGTNSSAVEVAVGPHQCDISAIQNDLIVCRISDTGATHVISATGKHRSKSHFCILFQNDLTLFRFL